MAQLTQPQSSGFNVDELAPAGTYAAVILDIIDLFGVQRPKFQNPQEKETLDVTRFLFGFQGQDGRYYKIQTREMRISGNTKAKLYQFLQGILGTPPKYGWDYCSLVGKSAMITVMHQQGRKDPSKTYAGIASVAPLPQMLANAVPPIAAFNYKREQAQGQTPQQPMQQQSYPNNGYNQTTPAPQQPAQIPVQPQPTQMQMATPAPVTTQPQAQAPQAQQPPSTQWDPEVDPESDCPF